MDSSSHSCQCYESPTDCFASSKISVMLRIDSPLMTFFTSSESRVSCTTRACASYVHNEIISVWVLTCDRTYPMQLYFLLFQQSSHSMLAIRHQSAEMKTSDRNARRYDAPYFLISSSISSCFAVLISLSWKTGPTFSEKPHFWFAQSNHQQKFPENKLIWSHLYHSRCSPCCLHDIRTGATG